MGMFAIYKTMTDKQADDISQQAKDGIKKFFEANPKRRICKAQLWNGNMYKIKRKDVDAQIDEIRKGIETVESKTAKEKEQNG